MVWRSLHREQRFPTYATAGGHRNLYRVAAARDDVLEVQRPVGRGGRGRLAVRGRGLGLAALDVEGLGVHRDLHRTRPVRAHGAVLVVEAFELEQNYMNC